MVMLTRLRGRRGYRILPQRGGMRGTLEGKTSAVRNMLEGRDGRADGTEGKQRAHNTFKWWEE